MLLITNHSEDPKDPTLDAQSAHMQRRIQKEITFVQPTAVVTLGSMTEHKMQRDILTSML